MIRDVNWAAAEGAILSLGSTWIEEERAYNFSLYARHADGVTLLLFREDDWARPVLEVVLHPRRHKTWDVWHCRLKEHELQGVGTMRTGLTGGGCRHPTTGMRTTREAPGRPLRSGSLLPTVV